MAGRPVWRIASGLEPLRRRGEKFSGIRQMFTVWLRGMIAQVPDFAEFIPLALNLHEYFGATV
jgi:hypothetical protein